MESSADSSLASFLQTLECCPQADYLQLHLCRAAPFLSGVHVILDLLVWGFQWARRHLWIAVGIHGMRRANSMQVKSNEVWWSAAEDLFI